MGRSLRSAFVFLNEVFECVWLTPVSFLFYSPFQPADNSNVPGAPAPIRSGYAGYFVRVLRAVRHSCDTGYHGVSRDRVFHGTKEGRRRALGISVKGQKRGRSDREGGEWKDQLRTGHLCSTAGVPMGSRFRSGNWEIGR